MLRVLQPGEAELLPNATAQGHARPYFAHTTIRARLIAVVLALVVPLNVVVIVVIWRLASAVNETQRTSLLYSARSIAAAVDAELGKYIALAQALSRSPALLEDNLDVFEDEVRRALASVPDVWALVADADGRQLFNTVVPRGHTLRSPYRSAEGIAAQVQAFKSGSVFVSDVAIGPDQWWVATANVPIF